MEKPRRKKGWMKLKVTKVVEETHDTVTLFLVNEEEGVRAFDYLAGQYLTFRFDDLADRPVVRSYTMSSSPREKETIAVTVKRVEGGLVSNYLVDKVPQGSVLKARGPIGRFCMPLATPTKHLVMVGAGSGVTPFIGILREYYDKLGQEGSPEAMSLLVAYRTKQDLICWDVLERVMVPGVKIVTTLTRDEGEGFIKGRPDPAMLDELVGGDYQEKTFMTCGPEIMMQMVVDHAKSMGVPHKDIHQESFA
jgi:ferredoxin-NADP reductase